MPIARRGISPHSLVMGVPGKVVKDLGPASAERNRVYSDNYVRHALAYMGKGG